MWSPGMFICETEKKVNVEKEEEMIDPEEQQL